MVALGDIVVEEDSLMICAWTAGMRAIDDNDEPILSNGFNTHVKKNLKIHAIAKDSMSERDMDLGSFGPTFEVHDLDNNDLVILKADGDDFAPLPLRSEAGVRKLDTV